MTSAALSAQVASPIGHPGRNESAPTPVCGPSTLDSPFFTVDSWVYPAVMRLYSLGFVDSAYLGMRPWTRASVEHMVEEAAARVEDADDGPSADEAQGILDALAHELNPDVEGPCGAMRGKLRIESVYTVVRAMSGTPLRDSFHLGQTIINDYGRPYANGFNNFTGASGYASAGRFTLYVRGEFQHAPSAAGYPLPLSVELSNIDGVPFINPLTATPYNQPTIPRGPIASVSNGRLLEAYASAHVLNHEISFGKQDDWLGPGLGGGMAYSNNAENIYSFRIDRVEPLRIPLLSRLTGPFRYDFLVGSLKGHTFPNSPWIHVEKISFKPTRNLEFGFERSVIWGGKGHVPITVHSFLKSFFSFSGVSAAEKASRDDPGARFGAFDFSYRLPFVRNWLTLYTDGEVHDDVSPIDAPRRAAWRPGLYLSHVPGIPKLDVRVEAATTDPPITNSNGGSFMYWETVQRQGYTNKGMLLGDWIGREGKGGQAWVTYHLSGNEWLQVGARNQKVAKDFVPGGTTLNDIDFQAVKRLGGDLEVNGTFKLEHWQAPIYLPGRQTVTSTTVQLTWYPREKSSF
ncbi:MAG TPA: capsule assembly Wzi family protein [Terracidiphilus sp.]|nr:capsule assembly Wzi family protein [Terracidiphilus sp.]